MPTAMAPALARHDEVMAYAVALHGGELVKTRGEGDSTFSVFDDAQRALAAAVEAQRTFDGEVWPDGIELRVRMAIHTGDAEERDGDYFGGTVNRTARLRAIAWGGQIVVSDAVATAAALLPEATWLLDLGLHRLKDLSRPERVHQLCHGQLRHGFPPLRSLDERPHNLPVQLTRFVGREEEQRDVAKLLEDRRLLTLTGSGGSGKTRLALQVAAEVAHDFVDGVWLVELAPITDAGLVATAIAGVLGVREEPGRPLLDSLVDDLRRRRSLIVLDNCEHVIGGAAEIAETVLRACPDLVVLATSRQPLGLAGEATWPVAPLGVPPETEVALEALNEYEAARLFLDRALLVRPALRVAPEDAVHVSRICRRLDGIPLALELAAARVTVLSLGQLAARIDDAFGLLTTGARTAPARQQTLRAAIDWSYSLLSEREREVLAALSVFPGGFTLDAAEAVAGDVLEALGQLVDKSLVVHDEERNRLLETVRSYAAERLVERGQADEVAARHLAWVASVPPRDVDLDSARAALKWSLEDAHDIDAGIQLALALSDRFDAEGRWAEGRTWLERGCAMSEDPTHRSTMSTEAANLALDQGDIDAASLLANEALVDGRAAGHSGAIGRAFMALGNIAHSQNDYDPALAHHCDARDHFQSAGDYAGLAMAYGSIASVAHARGDLAEALSQYQLGLDLARQHAGQDATVRLLLNVGTVLLRLGRLEDARGHFREALDIGRLARRMTSVAEATHGLGRVAEAEGDIAAARELNEESLRLRRTLGDKWGIAAALYGLGELARQAGDLDGAKTLLLESLTAWEELGHRAGAAAQKLSLGRLLTATGELEQARTFVMQALVTLREIGHRQGVLAAIDACAYIQVASGDPRRAVALVAATATLRTQSGEVLSSGDVRENEDLIVRLRDQLQGNFSKAWAEGEGLDIDAAVKLAEA